MSTPARMVLALAATIACTGAIAATELEGYTLDDSYTVSGRKLQYVGSAARKRGYFKTEVVALYLPERRQSLDEIYKLQGPKRIRLVILRELTGAMLQRYFISDFKLAASDVEFKQLINEVATIGGYYAQMGALQRGTVVNIDWLTDQGGIVCFIDGKPMGPPMKSELMYQVLLRMFISSGTPAAYRDAVLGLSRPE